MIIIIILYIYIIASVESLPSNEREIDIIEDILHIGDNEKVPVQIEYIFKDYLY